MTAEVGAACGADIRMHGFAGHPSEMTGRPNGRHSDTLHGATWRIAMSVTVSQHKNFVGGEWLDAVEGGTMEVINPATGETIAEVPRGTEADVERAVEAAKKALPEWLETTPGERA